MASWWFNGKCIHTSNIEFELDIKEITLYQKNNF
jgi:hypothetical protein